MFRFPHFNLFTFNVQCSMFGFHVSEVECECLISLSHIQLSNYDWRRSVVGVRNCSIDNVSIFILNLLQIESYDADLFTIICHVSICHVQLSLFAERLSIFCFRIRFLLGICRCPFTTYNCQFAVPRSRFPMSTFRPGISLISISKCPFQIVFYFSFSTTNTQELFDRMPNPFLRTPFYEILKDGVRNQAHPQETQGWPPLGETWA